MSLETLEGIVPGLVSKMGVSSQNFAVLTFIEQELHAVSPAAQIVAFKHNKVYVEVHSPVHLYDLTLKKRDLIKSLKKRLPAEEVESLEFRIFLKGAARLNALERMQFQKKKNVFGPGRN